MDCGSSTPSILELARDDGRGGADRAGVEAQRLGRDQAAKAMMVDDFQDFGGVKAVGGLQRLVVVDEDDLLAGFHGLDKARGLDAALAEDPLGLGRQRAQADRLVRGVDAVALRQLVLQIRVANSRADSIVVGILVTEHQNGCRHVIAPYLRRRAVGASFVLLIRGPAASAWDQLAIILPVCARGRNERKTPRSTRRRQETREPGRAGKFM